MHWAKPVALISGAKVEKYIQLIINKIHEKPDYFAVGNSRDITGKLLL